MKLLLTSNGLSNKSISKALFKLVGKPAIKTIIAFIPTAMNVATGSKEWFIDDLNNIKKQKCKAIDIVDISALPKNIWLPKLETADVLFFSGGNVFHLMYWLEKSGLAKLLPKLLRKKVYVGISAGSMVTNPTLALSSKDKKIYYEKTFGYKNEKALNLVNFYIRPHLNSPDFPHAQKKYIEKISQEAKIKKPIYALDDQSALKVIDNEIEIISEGKYLIL